MARLKTFTLTCSILASMTSFQAGLQYDDHLGSGKREVFMKINEISARKLENFVYFLSIFYSISPLVAGTLSDLIGRKYGLLLSPLFFLFGSVLTSLAPNDVVFFIGSVFVSIGISFSLAMTHVYINELSPDSTRGFLTTFPEVFWSIGYLVDSTFDSIYSEKLLNWRFQLALRTIPSILLVPAMLLSSPESPGWLVTRGKLIEARRVLAKTSVSEEEAELRLGDIKLSTESKESGWVRSWKNLLLHPSPTMQRALIAVVGLNFFRNSTGIEAVNIYSSRLLLKAGVKNKGDLLLVVSAVGLVRIFIILTAGILMDKIGRRPLLLASVSGMIFSLVGLGLGSTISNHSDKSKTLAWAVDLGVAMAFLCVAYFSAGLGPITWVYSSEAFPLRIRAQGASLGAAVNLVTRGLTSLAFLSSYGHITVGVAFLLFAGMASVAWLFFFKLLPETHGKSLEEKEIRCGNSAGGASTDEELSNVDGRVARSERFDSHQILYCNRKLQKKSASFPEFRPSSSLKNYFSSNVTQL